MKELFWKQLRKLEIKEFNWKEKGEKNMKQTMVKEFCVSDYRRTIKLEYRIYFALIFLISIPLATFTWVTCLIMNIFNSNAKKNEGIFKRAWGHAQVITPMIFTA